MKKIILLAFMVSICISQTPQLFYGNVQCACQQFLTQGECASNPQCTWNAVTPATGVTVQTGYCSLQICSKITSQKLCSIQPNCYYQPSSVAGAQTCFSMTGCESIVLPQGQSCQQTNYRCTTNPDQSKSACVTITECSLIKTSASCSGAVTTSEAQCIWTGSECKVIEQCSEIANQNLCGLLNHSCYWSNNQCIPQTCGNLVAGSSTPQTSCTYIVSSPFILNKIVTCLWNSTNSTCNQSNPSALSITNCATNTGFYNRWVGTTTQGQCLQCNSGRHVFRNQCECKQILLQSECGSYPACTWTSTTQTQGYYCTNNSCDGITSQSICSQIQSCYWNSTASTPTCSSYKQCSDIKLKTQLECYSSSIFCTGSDGTNCTSQSDLKPCAQSAIYKDANGVSTLLPSLCYNSIGTDGFCTYTPQSSGTMGSCGAINGCNSLTTKQQCDQFSNSCIWKQNASNTFSCVSKSCNDFLIQQKCTYVQPILTDNVINICYWNPNTYQCMSFDNSLDFDQNSCYNNTARTHHWSQPTNAQKGLCLPCQMSSVLNIKSQCNCTELTNYTDCALASPQCIWNAYNSQCIVQTCTNLTTQAQCILSNLCYWKVGKNGPGTCAAISTSQITCSSLNGTTQQECLAQSQTCPGTSGGKCASSYNSCSSFKTFYTCFGSVGTDGVCQWDEITASCSGISTCTMISTATQCDLVKNACFWQNSTSTCLAFNCSTIYSQTSQCTYYLTSPNQNYDVKQCMLSGTDCQQSSSGLNNLTSSTCYLNSGRQAKWINGTDGKYFCSACYSQLLTVLLLIISILV